MVQLILPILDANFSSILVAKFGTFHATCPLAYIYIQYIYLWCHNRDIRTNLAKYNNMAQEYILRYKITAYKMIIRTL
jgi:hypothetical protein